MNANRTNPMSRMIVSMMAAMSLVAAAEADRAAPSAKAKLAESSSAEIGTNQQNSLDVPAEEELTGPQACYAAETFVRSLANVEYAVAIEAYLRSGQALGALDVARFTAAWIEARSQVISMAEAMEEVVTLGWCPMIPPEGEQEEILPDRAE